MRGVEWIVGYTLASEAIEAGKEARNPFPDGTEEHRGFETAVEDLTRKE